MRPLGETDLQALRLSSGQATEQWRGRAFQRDPAYINQVRTDPAFDTIREAVEFVRLMAEVSGEQPPPSEGLRGFARRFFG